MAKAQSNAASRVFFTKDDTALPIPNLIAHQKDSWQEFVETGLSEIFAELNPIEDYTGQKLELRFNTLRISGIQNTLCTMRKKTILTLMRHFMPTSS